MQKLVERPDIADFVRRYAGEQSAICMRDATRTMRKMWSKGGLTGALSQYLREHLAQGMLVAGR